MHRRYGLDRERQQKGVLRDQRGRFRAGPHAEIAAGLAERQIGGPAHGGDLRIAFVGAHPGRQQQKTQRQRQVKV